MEHRIKELDYLKSILILLMVAFHLVYIGDKYPYIKQIVYTFHMPAFLIISGYLTNVQKDIRSFMRKLLWIFIPYLCLETGYVLMSHILPVRENVPEISSSILLHKIFIKPLGPYWYLHTLIICSLLYYLTFRYTRMKTISQVILLGLGLFAVSYWGGIIVLANAIYFLAGVIIKQSKLPFIRIFQPSLLALVPMILLCCFPDNLNRGILAGITITYLAIIISLYAHSYLSKGIRQCSYFIGRNTLVIFLFSPLFTILCKMFLPFLFFEPTGILFMIISVAITVSGCIVIAWSMDKLHFSRFFFGQDAILN
ncbi:acyltransferase family protein [Bacteroides intestinalis]|mgnify:FL=1|jgi:fucose 4-O-acetylase-like acetyltransferase|uniref:Acyltransferase n=1 Tax=Bacteroides intestinalis TaxID=329854 RepID=A0A3E4L2N7_9BACE|nr:acyltransferase [Bacteroides intestinalis]QDO68546.1 acyltransferase [Bacteroides intestinalis]RGK27641.1 acyltransferase [Bacteroides intestinalis]RGT46009.1 acyltransferase [Bacteroides intestinalis]RHI28228.1 acyltransferase [Bacteroides intestinalis]RHN10106.1 acyltransferase [Bacteroides intestinalis]